MSTNAPGTAQILGTYRAELIAAGIDDDVLPTLLIEAQRHLLSQRPLHVAAPPAPSVTYRINGDHLVAAVNHSQKKRGKSGLA